MKVGIAELSLLLESRIMHGILFIISNIFVYHIYKVLIEFYSCSHFHGTVIIAQSH